MLLQYTAEDYTMIRLEDNGAKIKVSGGEIIEVPEERVDFFLHNGFRAVEEKPEVKATKKEKTEEAKPTPKKKK